MHAHDWQAGLAPAYLRYWGVPRPSVMTIHNIAFQGGFPASVFGQLELPPQAFALDGVEFHGGVGYLKAGLACASAITTVSPTYAEEIKTPEFGLGLQGLISSRSGVLHGIVNGIDTEVWNPETDPLLAAPFSARRLQGRAANRTAIEKRFGLHADGSALFVLVSRLTWQKGIDLLAWITRQDIVEAGHRLAVLGSGDAGLEATFLTLAAQHPGRVGVVVGYDEPLSHTMQGGGDAILIPSRFEPCGLTQLYGLRYGCVPIVAHTGGLADTVIDANLAALNAGAATGFQFTPVDAAPARRRDPPRHDADARPAPPGPRSRRQGMKSDVSWDRSAAAYADLYASLRRDDRHDHDPRHQALRRPEARHLGPAQEGSALPAADLRRELRPVDLRQPRRLRGQDAGHRRRRPLLQPRGHPDRAEDGRRQRLRPGSRRPRRHPLDARPPPT